MGLLWWALIFLIIASVAAVFGFGGIATAAAGVAKLLFLVLPAIFLVLLIVGLIGVGAAVSLSDRCRPTSAVPGQAGVSRRRGRPSLTANVSLSRTRN